MRLHIDIETYSDVNIKTQGAYKYVDSDAFEILLIAYAIDDNPVTYLDIQSLGYIPDEFLDLLLDPEIKKYAFNANFERICFRKVGYDVPANEWRCTSVKSGYCGLPLGLAGVSIALKLGADKAKLAEGKKLITYFCIPCKPTKANGYRERNYPEHDREKWQRFINYCIRDVVAEREVHYHLEKYHITELEFRLYELDQKINDRGVRLDIEFCRTALRLYAKFKLLAFERMREITGLENPNSPPQLAKWLSHKLGKNIKSIAKDALKPLLELTNDGAVLETLKLRSSLSKTSIAKYDAALRSVCSDGRGRGFIQFYGASRTGRWAGRIVQPQNLKRNYIQPIEDAREVVASNDYETFRLLYDVPETLSQLVRTLFIANEGMTLAPADFSAIEARVVAWLANEKWRLDVFNGDGKIYEASASKMFNVPIESVTKGSDLRARGKVAELALGYGGSVGAMRQMGGEALGLNDNEMKSIVERWRGANSAIVSIWKEYDRLAKKAIAIRNDKPFKSSDGLLTFTCDDKSFKIKLPSGRKLFYREPSFTTNRWGHKAIQYKGLNDKNQWLNIQSYGGKLLENISQAIARDLLAESMLALDDEGYDIVLHVHDESIPEIPIDGSEDALVDICEIMGRPIHWAKGLPLNADGYLTPFYKKD